METQILQNKIDFTALVTVTRANSNGDPLNGNRPRETFEGYGEISDVAIKRKIRNRLQDMGERIFVQMEERSDDGCGSLKERASSCERLETEIKKGKKADKDICSQIACEEWLDVRAFGQVFAFKGVEVSLGIRGPVSIHSAFSVDPIDIESIQITKSVNGEDTKGKESQKASDTMGEKHRVRFGLYVIKGSINCQLAEKTGFTGEDADKIKEALLTLFENDCSSARPDGSMVVQKVYWWKHNCKSGQYSSAKVHGSLKVSLKEGINLPNSFADYEVRVEELPGLEPEVIDGK